MLQVHLAVEGFDSSLTIRFLGIEGQITIIILLLFCQCVSPKLVSLHDNICEAFFQDPIALIDWSAAQPLSPILTCLGDGHDGIWNVIEKFGKNQVPIKREVLDWYHLKENLYKVGGSLRRLASVENLLWQGWVDAAIAEFDGLKHKRAVNFQVYLEKHRHHIPNYAQYQQLDIPIGSGDVESKIKQVAARVKPSGAR